MTQYFGQQLADSYIKKDLIRKIIYQQSALMSVGMQVIEQVNLPMLDIKYDYPSELTGQYPVADDAVASREKIVWSEFTGALQKGQVHYMLLDSSRLRAVSGTQGVIMARRAAEAMATQIDDEIMGVLYAGAGCTAVTAGAKWNTSTADAEADVVDAWKYILDESNVKEQDLKNMTLIVPTAGATALKKLTLIGNVQRSVEDYLGKGYNIDIKFTRTTKLGASSSTDALLMVNGGLTAQHLVLSSSAASAAEVPLVESERVLGSGDDYLISRWWKSVIIEDGRASSSGQNCRICKIQTVV